MTSSKTHRDASRYAKGGTNDAETHTCHDINLHRNHEQLTAPASPNPTRAPPPQTAQVSCRRSWHGLWWLRRLAKQHHSDHKPCQDRTLRDREDERANRFFGKVAPSTQHLVTAGRKTTCHRRLSRGAALARWRRGSGHQLSRPRRRSPNASARRDRMTATWPSPGRVARLVEAAGEGPIARHTHRHDVHPLPTSLSAAPSARSPLSSDVLTRTAPLTNTTHE